ncbi:MAG: polysaccharide pyruvyl transferase family protein [Eubacterium sp.]|nr:polysaccharide pyruvyl transferase family protein [Eubacterium sp.]
MKKIGVITFFISNYGSVLQGFATKTFLKKNGYEPVMIDKTFFPVEDKVLEDAGKKHPQSIEDFNFFLKSLEGNAAIVSDKSLAAIDAFIRDVLSPEKYTIAELEKSAGNKDFDAFIVGSDQVWNTTMGVVDPFLFLLFAPPEMRIPLCPSLGTKQIHDYLKDELRDVFNEYPRLTVRETDGAEVIRELTGREATRLPDPTVLLTPDEWREVAGVSDDDEKGYLLLHFLNAPNSIAIQNIKRIADMTGMPVRCFANRYDEYDDISGVTLIEGGPKDYVRVINNAGFICTDSFHTTMFCINLDKDFYTFDRQYAHGVSEIGRLTTVLGLYDLTDRMILDESFVPDRDKMPIGKDIKPIRDRERTSIRTYLLEALGAV